MKTKRIRESKASIYKTEAALWDKRDTSPQMKDDGAWFAFEIAPREDRCSRCGSQMRAQAIDLHLLDNRVTLHRIQLLVCPTCQNVQMPRAVEEFSKEIEATALKVGLVKQAA